MVRYAKDTIRVGHEFRVFYAAESVLKNFKEPQFDSSKWKVGAQSMPFAIKDRPWVDGKREELNLSGYSFFVTPVDTGWCPLPSATAKVDGKMLSTPAYGVYVLPLYDPLAGCEVKMVPAKPVAGKQFELVVSSKTRLDVHPEIDFGDLKAIITRPKVGMSMDQSGSKYTYTYLLMADQAGTYSIAPFDVYISRKAYTVSEFNIEVRENPNK